MAKVELECADFVTVHNGVFHIVLDDFLRGAIGAKEKFARIIQHLEEHAVPQIAPEWISKSLSALNGK